MNFDGKIASNQQASGKKWALKITIPHPVKPHLYRNGVLSIFLPICEIHLAIHLALTRALWEFLEKFVQKFSEP